MSGQSLRASLSIGSAIAISAVAVTSVAASAKVAVQPVTANESPIAESPTAIASQCDPFAIFAPTRTPVRHRIDYGIWDYALKQMVVWMGPSLRKRPAIFQQAVAQGRLRAGHNSRFRTEGALVAFSRMDQEAIASFGLYRQELEQVADTLDISTLPRNEQLAFWLNLHNVAMVEKIAENWPFRQPRALMIDGVPLDEAKFLNVRSVAMSLRDIRENIVYANWRDPKVIYGFWRGEIGSPSLERVAYSGGNVSSLLSIKAEEYINSLRATEKRGDTLHVSTLYDEVSRFYFPDFDADVRAHMTEFAKEDVLQMIGRTSRTEATIREWDIADLSGGRRDSISAQSARPGVSAGMMEILGQRERKFRELAREKIPTGRVFLTEITLPGDDPNKGEVK
ncbi:MAG: DUF547 domain-containing protein [Erythrobacter sp.]|uniref:DUF547 domain-containing protein n=1 Tax=Erythrobacter sp. TaxID=1042 RepID=UPI002618D442|nr:DUF547 domain-containing protein [Erythrobacter sp.]MDJ0979737.1 DUF547 domain-containing protein [Erythrobacter sp.]